MYLHAGNARIIRSSGIIGIFDLDNATKGPDTRAFLKTAEKEERTESAGQALPKSFILFKDREEYRICFSQISTSALIKRTNRKERI